MIFNSIDSSYFVFKIADDDYAISVKQVQNILEYQIPAKVPETPHFLLGIINVRGELLPVVDGRAKFGFESKITNSESCIVSINITNNSESFVVGLLVDRAIDVEDLSEDCMGSVPDMGVDINPEYVSSIYTKDERIVFVLNVDAIFSNDEITLIKNSNK